MKLFVGLVFEDADGDVFVIEKVEKSTITYRYTKCRWQAQDEFKNRPEQFMSRLSEYKSKPLKSSIIKQFFNESAD